MDGQKATFIKRFEPLAVMLFLLFLSLFFYNGHLTEFPSHLHAWTQSDRYALAVGYLENGLNLFLPSTPNLFPKYPPNEASSNYAGITGAALPLPEYVAALLMKATGLKHPGVLRLLVWLTGLTGLVAFYLAARKLGAVASLAFFATLFAFSTPVFAYYLNGFIPGIPALALAFGGIYFYICYQQNNRLKHYALSLAMLTLAALIRPPFLIPLLAVIFTQGISGWHKKVRFREWMLAALHLLVIAAFWMWDKQLLATYGSQFNNHLLPAGSISDWVMLMAKAWSNWSLSYFTGYHYLFLGGIAILVFVQLKRKSSHTERNITLFVLLHLIASVLYSYAMAQQFPAHDYYFLDSFFLPLATLLLLAMPVIQPEQRIQTMMLWVVALAASGLMIAASYKVQQQRYITHSWDMVETTRQNFEGSNAFLATAGVAPDARVLVLDAYTSNVPLLLMERKGFTVIETSASNLEAALKLPFDCIVVQNQSLGSEVLRNLPSLAQHLEPLANNGKIGIYRHTAQADSTQHWAKLLLSASKKPVAEADTSKHCLQSDVAFFALSDTILQRPDTAILALLYEADASRATMQGAGIQLVLDATGPGDFRFYKSHAIMPFFEKGNGEARLQFFINLPQNVPDSTRLKAYLWNPGKNEICLKNQTVLFTKYQTHF